MVHSLEECTCPAGYTGLSCEKCDYGYTRVEPQLGQDNFVCSLCNCNGHSPGCNLLTGQCDVRIPLIYEFNSHFNNFGDLVFRFQTFFGGGEWELTYTKVI